MLLPAFLGLGLASLTSAAKPISPGDEYLSLAVSRHNPCPIHEFNFPKDFGLSPARKAQLQQQRIIVFPNSQTAPVQAGKPGCYRIQGAFSVPRPVSGDLQLYTELRLGAKPAPFKRCRDWEQSGCGGNGGSCLTCDVCDRGEALEGRARFARLLLNGQRLSCDANIPVNTSTPFQFTFCLPTRDQLIADGDTTAEEWRAQFEDGGKLRVYLRTFIFEEDMRGLFARRHARMQRCKDELNPLAIRECEREFWSEQGRIEATTIGCHAIFGRLFADAVGASPAPSPRGLGIRHGGAGSRRRNGAGLSRLGLRRGHNKGLPRRTLGG